VRGTHQKEEKEMRDLREKLDDLLYLLNDSRYVKVDNDHEMIFIWNGYATITVLDIENFSEVDIMHVSSFASPDQVERAVKDYIDRLGLTPAMLAKEAYESIHSMLDWIPDYYEYYASPFSLEPRTLEGRHIKPREIEAEPAAFMDAVQAVKAELEGELARSEAPEKLIPYIEVALTHAAQALTILRKLCG